MKMLGSFFENNLPPNEYCAYYPRKHSNLFFSNSPLLEDFPESRISNLRFLFGHGVDRDVIRLASSANPGTTTLIANMRDPVKLFESKVAHRSDVFNKKGRPKRPHELAKRFLRNDLQASSIFGVLHPDNAPKSAEEAHSKYGFIFLTERLNEQLMFLGKALGFKVPPEHKNSNPNKELIATRTEIEYLQGGLDQEAHDRLIQEWDKFAVTSPGSALEFNPYRIRTPNQPSKISEKDRSEILVQSYRKLFKFMAHQNSLPAAKLLVENTPHRIKKNKRLVEAFYEEEAAYQCKTDADKSIMLFHKAGYFKRNQKNRPEAIRLY